MKTLDNLRLLNNLAKNNQVLIAISDRGLIVTLDRGVLEAGYRNVLGSYYGKRAEREVQKCKLISVDETDKQGTRRRIVTL